MNFLGHIFLSPDNDEILLGNFIADSVKGNPDKFYSGNIAEGIRFHRAIDHFTDNHPLVKQGVQRFRATQGRFSPVVIDVVYDHVLAANWDQFHESELGSFTQSIYHRLESQSEHFPIYVQRFFPYMKEQNWLYNYRFDWGLLKSLQGLDRRTIIETEMHLASEVYAKNQAEFDSEFSEFIEDAKKMVASYFSG